MGEDGALIGRFLEMMAAERGASRNTLLAYRADLEGAAKILGGLSAASKDAVAGRGTIRRRFVSWNVSSRITT